MQCSSFWTERERARLSLLILLHVFVLFDKFLGCIDLDLFVCFLSMGKYANDIKRCGHNACVHMTSCPVSKTTQCVQQACRDWMHLHSVEQFYWVRVEKA